MVDEDLIPLEPDAGAEPAAAPPAKPAVPAAAPAASEPAADPNAAPAAAAADAADDPELDPEKEADPRVKGILKALATTRRELKTSREIAQTGVELARRLGGRPDVIAMLNGETPAPAKPVPATPEGPPEPTAAELKEMAESLALYDASGKLDLEAAKRVHTHTTSIAERAATRAVERAVTPLRDRVVKGEAAERRTEALTVAKSLGVDDTIAHRVIDGLMQTNPDALANPEAATTAILVAVGVDTIQQRQGKGPKPAASAADPNKPPAPAPTFVEGGGARPTVPTMSKLEQQIAKRAGVKPEDWMRVTAGVANAKPDTRFHVMEDDE